MIVKPKVETLAIAGPTHATLAAPPSIDETKTQLKQGANRAMKTAEHLVQFSQGNLEAFIKSGQVLASGWTDLSKHMVAHAQSSMEHTATTVKAMSGVKSFKEAIELQTAFTKSYFEKAMAETSKLTEQGLKLAEAASAPLTARVNAAVETFSA